MNRDKSILIYLGNFVGAMAVFFGIGEGWQQRGSTFGGQIDYTFAFLILGGIICLLITEIMKRCN